MTEPMTAKKAKQLAGSECENDLHCYLVYERGFASGFLAAHEAMKPLVKYASLVLESHKRTCPGETCGTMGVDMLAMELGNYRKNVLGE